MLQLRLQPGLPGRSWIRLRSLEGRIELSVDPSDPAAFIELLEELLAEGNDQTLRRNEVSDLPVCDLDAIAAYLQIHYFGSLVESSLRCSRCDHAFDLSFDLDPFLEDRGPNRSAEVSGPDEDGAYRLKDGRRFRLPNAKDMLAAGRLSEADAIQEIRRRCVLAGDFSEDPETLEEAMEAVGPMLSQRLQAACPHCGQTQAVQFQMQSFFLESLAFERRYLNYEIHYLARGYGWSRNEILEMTREDRRLHAKLLLAAS